MVIPAHNEADVLSLSLGALVDQDVEGDLDIVVVANGCDDATAAIARDHVAPARRRGYSLRVCELPVGNKTVALNTGDELKRFATTLYLDADVVLSTTAVRQVWHALHEHDHIALASPQMHIAESRSVVSRAYGRVWSGLPYMQHRVRGVGCYAVTGAGRARWDRFPDLLADDRFARLHFREHEQMVATGASYVWALPEGAVELTRVRARWLLGNAELADRRPDLVELDRRRYDGLARFVLAHPHLWHDICVFLGVYMLAWVIMTRRRIAGDRTWHRATRARAQQRTLVGR